MRATWGALLRFLLLVAAACSSSLVLQAVVAADGDGPELTLSSRLFDGTPVWQSPFSANLTHTAGCAGERRVDVGLPSVSPGYQVCCDATMVWQQGLGEIPPSAAMGVCLPSFIIAGCQKTGTTALAVMLDEHPNIGMSLVKEVHYFDKIRAPSANPQRRKRNMDAYAGYFPGFSATAADAPAGAPPFITGEATPFYMASTYACEEIARRLPTAKLLVLVREPVERAYSEFKMKVRRVVDQDALIDALAANAAAARACLLDAADHPAAPRNVTAALALVARTTTCLAAAVGASGKLDQFTGPLLRRMAEAEAAALRGGGSGGTSGGGGRRRRPGGSGGRRARFEDGSGGGSGGSGAYADAARRGVPRRDIAPRRPGPVREAVVTGDFSGSDEGGGGGAESARFVGGDGGVSRSGGGRRRELGEALDARRAVVEECFPAVACDARGGGGGSGSGEGDCADATGGDDQVMVRVRDERC